jgi:hypothetical protein
MYSKRYVIILIWFQKWTDLPPYGIDKQRRMSVGYRNKKPKQQIVFIEIGTTIEFGGFFLRSLFYPLL